MENNGCFPALLALVVFAFGPQAIINVIEGVRNLLSALEEGTQDD